MAVHREKRTVEALPWRDFEVVSELRTERKTAGFSVGSDGTVPPYKGKTA